MLSGESKKPEMCTRTSPVFLLELLCSQYAGAGTFLELAKEGVGVIVEWCFGARQNGHHDQNIVQAMI